MADDWLRNRNVSNVMVMKANAALSDRLRGLER